MIALSFEGRGVGGEAESGRANGGRGNGGRGKRRDGTGGRARSSILTFQYKMFYEKYS